MKKGEEVGRGSLVLDGKGAEFVLENLDDIGVQSKGVKKVEPACHSRMAYSLPPSPMDQGWLGGSTKRCKALAGRSHNESSFLGMGG